MRDAQLPLCYIAKKMAVPIGIEPILTQVQGLPHYRYARGLMADVNGVEPLSPVPETGIIPLY